MHNTKMAQAKINSTEKIGLGTTKKLLVPKFIELLWEYPCLYQRFQSRMNTAQPAANYSTSA